MERSDREQAAQNERRYWEQARVQQVKLADLLDLQLAIARLQLADLQRQGRP